MTIISPCDLPPTPTPSTMRRHSVRPLRSSPLAGPALSSEGFAIPNEDMQGKAKPSRISTSDLSSSTSSLYSLDSLDPIPHFPSPPPHLGIFMPMFDKRKSSPPGFLATISASSSSYPFPIPPITPPPTPKASSHLSRESTKPFPGAAHTATPSNFPRVLHRNPSPECGDWLSANTFGETPRFSRVRIGSNVVMPISAREYRRKSIAGAKSPPIFNHRKRPSSSHGTGSSGASASAGASREETLVVQSLESDKARKSTSTLGSARYGADSVDSMPSSQNSSFSSEDGSEDMDSTLRPPPPSSVHSSKSGCDVIDEKTENGLLVSDLLIPLPGAPIWENTPAFATTPSTRVHRHSLSEVSSSGRPTANSHNNSFDTLKSRTKTVLKKNKSFVHSRTTSTADSVLEASLIAPRMARHVKGLSFLSFSSTEESQQIAPVSPLSDDIYESNPGLANQENELFLHDTLSRPSPIHDGTVRLVLPNIMTRRSVLRKSAIIPPLPLHAKCPVPSTNVLHFPSASSSFDSHQSPVIPPSPSRAQNSKKDQMLEPAYEFHGSSSSLGSPIASSFSSSTSSPSKYSRYRTSSFLNVEEDENDLPSSCSSPKAISFSGVGEPPRLRTVSGSPSCNDPWEATTLYTGDTDPQPWSGNSSKATKVLGSPTVPRNKSETHLDTVLGFGGRSSPQATKGVGRSGTLKKLWKSLTGGQESRV